MVLLTGHKTCFKAEIYEIITTLSLLPLLNYCIESLHYNYLTVYAAKHKLSPNYQVLHIGTERSKQREQAQIKLLPSQGLHCFPFHLHLLDALQYIGKPNCLILRTIIVSLFFTVLQYNQKHICPLIHSLFHSFIKNTSDENPW